MVDACTTLTSFEPDTGLIPIHSRAPTSAPLLAQADDPFPTQLNSQISL